MGLSKQELKSIVKETVQELLVDNQFMEVLVKKMSDKIDNLEKVINKNSEQVVSIETKMDDTVTRLNERIKIVEDNICRKEQEIRKLEDKIEQIQQGNKLNNICIYGLSVDKNENLLERVKNVINNSIKLMVRDTDIVTCYRVGINASRPQPVIVKFETQAIRNSVLLNCKNLKGTSMGITEDLTKKRLTLYRRAQEVFGRKSVFIRNGNVIVKIKDARHRISDECDIQNLEAK